MLGRLRMTLDECEAAYLQLSRQIFEPAHYQVNLPARFNNFIQAKGKFRHEPLEKCIQGILAARNMDIHELLKENNKDACKVYVPYLSTKYR